MNETQFAKEMKAYDAFQQLTRTAQEVAGLFQSALLEVPPPLARMLGMAPTRGPVGEQRPRLSISPLESPSKPQEATDEWIWIPARDATATVLLYAILRTNDGPMEAKDALEQIRVLKSHVNPGSVFNVVARVGSEVIEKVGDGWKLVNREMAPMLIEKELWGPPDAFGKYELAVHRRMVVLHLLEASPGGLQIMQIVSQLENNPICQAPMNKDLLKTDMSILQTQGKAKRISNSKKWVRVERKNAKP